MDFSFSKNCAHLRELTDAIKIRDIKTITDLLNNNPDIEPNQLDDHKLIHQVVHYSCANHELQASVIKVLRLFLDFGVNVNVKDDDGCTVLHLAIDYRMRKVIDFLISRNADLHVRDKFGNSILHFLIKREMIKVERSLSSNRLFLKKNSIESRQLKKHKTESADFIRWMMLKGLDVDNQNNDGDTVLHYLLKNQRRYFAKIILEYSENVDKPNGDGNTPLNIILDCGNDISYQYYSDDEEIVLSLLEKGADIHKVNIYGASPMINAVTSRNLSILQLFKKRGFNFHQSDDAGNLLHHFFKPKIAKRVQTQEPVFDFLIDEGCDVNATDVEGRTPLHFAARNTNHRPVERLIKLGANVNSQEFTRGYAPLHEAVEQSCYKIVTMLIENGANVNVKSKKGRTPLFLINIKFTQTPGISQQFRKTNEAYRGRSIAFGPKERYITRALMEHGAQIDVRDNDGYLPLQAAIHREDAGLMHELLPFGADINYNTDVLTDRDCQFLRRTIGRHMIELQVANLPIDEKLKCLPILFDDATRVKCLIDVKRLKSYKMTDRMSLYDFLHLKRNTTCLYVKNEKLMELTSSVTLETQFPMYHTLISSAYYMAVERQKMLETAKQSWLELTDIILPDLCLCEILNHVCNVTLRTMIDGAELVL